MTRYLRFEISEPIALELPDDLKLGDTFEATASIVVTRVEDELEQLRVDASGENELVRGRGSANLLIRLSPR